VLGGISCRAIKNFINLWRSDAWLATARDARGVRVVSEKFCCWLSIPILAALIE